MPLRGVLAKTNFQMKTKSNYTLALLVVGMGVFSSCQENEASAEFTEAVTFAENVFAQSASDLDDTEVSFSGSASSRFRPPFRRGFGECVTTESEGEAGEFPRVVTLTFDGGCEVQGVTKSGTLIITLTGARDEIGTQRIMEYQDFTVNGYVLNGTEVFTHNGNRTFSVSLEDGTIVTPDGESITWYHEKERIQVEGQDTEDTQDDVFETTGTSNGVSRNGSFYTREITSPLVSSRDCFWITSGVVESNVDGDIVITDFGDGTCDDIAIRTENGESEEITMDFRMKKGFRKGF